MRIRALTLAVTLFTVLSSAGCGGGSGGVTDAAQPPAQQLTFEQVVNMPAGFQVIGSHGSVQVDGSYFNLGLVAKGTVQIPAAGSITQSVPDISLITPQITATGISPILCLRSLQTQVAIARVKRSGSTFQYTIIGTPTASGETVQWFLFDQMTLALKAGQSNAGIQVFDGVGSIVFDSNAYPMRVAAVGKVPDQDLINVPGAVSAASVGTFAACVTQGRIDSFYVAGNGGYSQVFTEGAQITSTGAVTGEVPLYYAKNIEIHPKSSIGGQILLVDVSGL